MQKYASAAARRHATIPRLNKIARGQDPWTRRIAAKRTAATTSHIQKNGAGANFRIKSEATTALSAIEAVFARTDMLLSHSLR